MKKDAYYFPHFCNAKQDRKIKRVRKDLGLEGYGIFFMLLETLREQTDFKYPLTDIDLLADEFGTSKAKVEAVINSYDLFLIDDENNFFSPKLVLYLQPYFEKSERASIAAKTRWDKVKQISPPIKNNANAMQMHNKCNTNEMHEQCASNASKVKESKVKESKVKESKEETSDSLTLSLYTEKITNGKWFIAKDTDKLNVLIEMYSYDWVKDAVSKAVLKEKYSISYTEAILKNWTVEGKEENRGNGSIDKQNKGTSEESHYDFSSLRV